MLARVPSVHASRRGRRILAIEPESAGWAVLSEGDWGLLGMLTRPMAVRDFMHAAAIRGWEAEQTRSWLGRMLGAGFLEVDGRRSADPRDLWKPPPDQVRFVSIHVAEGCNMRCRYCYADSEPSSHRMSRSLLLGVLEKILRELPSTSLTVDFIGGEPLLAFDDLVEAMGHGRLLARSLGKQVGFILQTNGLLLTRERAQILKHLDVGVGVSIDGPAALHDRHRVRSGGEGTHREVLENLLQAREVGLRVAPLAVVHEPSAFVEVLDFFLEHGFEFMRLNPASPMGRAREMTEITGRAPEVFAQGLLAMARRAHAWCEIHDTRLRIQDLDHMLTALTTRQRDYMCMRSPCGMGRSILSFGPRGEILACEEVERTTRARMLLGHVDDGPLGDVVGASPALPALRERRVESIPRCSRCHLRRICGGGCGHKALAAFGDLQREDPMCRYYQVAFEELMWWIHDEPLVLAHLGGSPEACP